jgi:L-histidine Nalpha-methyltransferase / hercynylcysteine S-oxide synthase
MPVTQNGNKLCGLAEMGGLWEWTSSPLEKINGFEPMKMYPAFSGEYQPNRDHYSRNDAKLMNIQADFHDQKHNIMLGGSWATHPRLAGRKTL